VLFGGSERKELELKMKQEGAAATRAIAYLEMASAPVRVCAAL
jgi:hypothetical protein